MGLRGFIAGQNICLECLQVLHVLGKNRAAVLARKTFTPEILFSAVRKERLAVGVRRRLWTVPDLATEGATDTRQLRPLDYEDYALGWQTGGRGTAPLTARTVMLHRYSPRKPVICSLKQFDMCLKTRHV